MKKTNFRSMTITVLMIALALVLSFAVGLLNPVATASAVEYKPSEIFSSGSNSSVSASDDASYVQFEHSKDDASVYFRRDLALKWFNAEGENYFSLTLAFPEINFTTYSVNFESAEENISKEETAKNAIVFTNGADGVTASVKNAEQQEKEAENGIKVDFSGDVVISLGASDGEVGEYDVYVNGEKIGTFTNIGGNYIEYFSTATDTPRTPVTFKADKLSGTNAQKVLVKELNGQSFALNQNKEIEDNAAPVMVINEEVHALRLGSRFSLSYEAIDVCDTTVSVTRQYYMAAANDKGEYLLPTDKNYKTLTSSTTFVPTDDKGETEVQYVSIRFSLNDGRPSTDDTDEHVYLSWYAVDSAVQTLGTGENAHEYILVNREQGGPHYVGLEAQATVEEGKPGGENVKVGLDDTDVDGDGDKSEALIDALADAFQAKVTEEAAKRSAGDGSYFYVPSLRGLIASEYTDYRNLTFNIYYYHQSMSVSDKASSASSLDYNELRFEIEQSGTYVFRVMATANSNNMQYYMDGRLVDVNSSNIWEIDEIPEFRFTVRYDGAVIEAAEEQKLGYRGQEYKVSDFEIVAVSGYEEEYKLFVLDESKIPENLRNYSYSELVGDAEHYFGKDGVFKEYLKEIRAFNSSVEEDDTAAWDRTDNDYHWNPDSRRFTPVAAGYYVVQLTVKDAIIPNHNAVGFQVIDARNPIDTLPDATYWLENNVVAVVLFSISGVLLIVVIILFVTSPSKKKVDEVDLEKLKGQNKKSKK